jgi:hypothetical protein
MAKAKTHTYENKMGEQVLGKIPFED